MKFEIARRDLARPIQLVTGVVERRQTMQMLSNVRLVVEADVVTLAATDLEIELVARTALTNPASEPGDVAIPARKLADVWRSLPEDAAVAIADTADRISLRAGRTKFQLSAKRAEAFPTIDASEAVRVFHVERTALASLIGRTSFSMAQQDVRYFLNGLLLEFGDGTLRAVATDGHRLATSVIDASGDGSTPKVQAIVPRKAVQEVARLLAEGEDQVELRVGDSHLQVVTGGIRLVTKLIDGRFPDYEKVIPARGPTELIGSREELRQAFTRASILSNEKYRGVRMTITESLLAVHANNPEQEEAEESVELETSGPPLEISFNVSYLVDALAAMPSEAVRISLTDANSSARLEGLGDDVSVYVVMPMRL